MIVINNHYTIEETEVTFTFIRSPGPGGQNVNKVATAVLLRFNVPKSSLPESIKERIMVKCANALTAREWGQACACASIINPIILLNSSFFVAIIRCKVRVSVE